MKVKQIQGTGQNEQPLQQPVPKKKKRGAKLLLVGIVTLACLLVAVTAINFAVVYSTRGRVVNEEKASQLQADCILVLGAGVRKDGSPSDMLYDRVASGVQLYHAGAAPVILMSGDHAKEGYNEVDPMQELAQQLGVPAADIQQDPLGLSTYESLYRLKTEFGVEKVIIVTQRYHLYRALYIADQLGLEAYGYSADLRSYAGQPVRQVREYAARVKDFLLCIGLSGSGAGKSSG